MSMNGVGIDMDSIHLQSKLILKDLREARIEYIVVGRGITMRGVLVSPSAMSAFPPFVTATLVFVW